MNGEKLIDILEFLDDDLLMEANLKRENRKKVIFFRTLIAAAACIAILILSLSILPRHSSETKNEYHAVRSYKGRIFGKTFEEYMAEINNNRRPEGEDNVLAVETEVPDNEDDNKLALNPQTTKVPFVSLPPGQTNLPLHTAIPGVTEGTDEGGSVKPTIVPSNPQETKEPLLPPEFIIPTREPIPSTELPDQTDTPMEPMSTPEPTQDPTQVPTPTPGPTDNTSWMSALAANDTLRGNDVFLSNKNYVLAWYSEALDTDINIPVPTDEPDEPEEPGITVEPTEVPAPEPPPSEEMLDGTGEPEFSLVGIYEYYWGKRIVKPEYIDSVFRKFSLVGIYENGIKNAKTVDSYSIKGTMRMVVTAICNKSSEYCLFINSYYKPSDLSDLIKSFNMQEYLEFKGMVGYDTDDIITFIKDDAVWEILSKPTAQAVDPLEIYHDCKLAASLVFSSDLYGYENVPIAIYEEGYIIIEWFGNVWAFDAGEETVDELLDLLKP